MQTQDTEIKRRADGTIDAEHYLERGRTERARTIRAGLAKAPASPGLLAGLAAAALAAVTFRPPGA